MPDRVFPIEGTIIDLTEKRSFIKFWSFDPPTGSVQANYQHESPHGRWAPHRFYLHTGPHDHEFVIHLNASIEEADERTAQDVYREYLFLLSLNYEDLGPNRKGPVTPPHKILISWGQAMRWSGVMKNFRYQWVPPYDENGYPFHIDCSFTLEQDQDTEPYDVRTVRDEANMVGLGLSLGRTV